MVGHSRAGRLPSVPIPIAEATDRPEKPKGFGKKQSEHWDLLTKNAEHLTAKDGSTLAMACEVWVLWHDVLKLAKQDLTDYHLASQINKYAQQYQAALKMLCLDPLGKLRAVKNTKREQGKPKELKYFT